MMLLGNYILSAWRNILRHKLFSAINILGLAIGLAAVMLIALFVRYETSYDSFWKNADNIYRLQITFTAPGRGPNPAVTAPTLIAPFLKQDFPEVTHVARAVPLNAAFIQGNNRIQEEIRIADQDILNVFDFEIVAGDIETALNDNYSLILNETLAAKYFGDENPLGESITLETRVFTREYKVAAIIKDIPVNSQVNINAMIGLFESDWADDEALFKSWFRSYSFTYYTVKPGTDIANINNKMKDFIDRHYPSNLSGDPDNKPSDEVSLSSLNIKDLHLKAAGLGQQRPRGDYGTIIAFTLIAILILIIASINFMNLSTARASQRAKEVSIRKVMGAVRTNLIIQFIGESIALTLISLLLGLVIVEISLPFYNELIGKTLIIEYGSADIGNILTLALSVGILAGFYPAFILSGYRPSEKLKSNKSVETKASINFRTVLVIVQFTISIALFISTAVIYSQIQYTKNFNLGFNEENILLIKGIRDNEVRDKTGLLIDELKKVTDVIDVTSTSITPGVYGVTASNMRTSGMAEGETVLIGDHKVGYDFFKTFGIEIINGRAFEESRNEFEASEELVRQGNAPVSSMVINELAVRQLGFKSPEDAIGKSVSGTNYLGGDLAKNYQIIGVTSNIYFESLKNTVRPEMYVLNPYFTSTIAIRYAGNPQVIIENTRSVWQQQFPNVPFRYDFVSDAIDEQYWEEHGQMTMFTAFSGLAIFIACLGLFGLASFTAERRTKEIGVRKVFGAEVWQIVKLLVWQFSKPVLIANVIAWPIAYLAMSRWLESFVYRIDDMVIIALCLIAGLIALLIAWATVAGNSYAVARTNPIKALRYE